jgi:hypothetical protein
MSVSGLTLFPVMTLSLIITIAPVAKPPAGPGIKTSPPTAMAVSPPGLEWVTRSVIVTLGWRPSVSSRPSDRRS